MPVVPLVAHLDMDAFFASCEIARRPELAGRPVVVGGDPHGGTGRGVVTAANYEARALGVRSAMPIAAAWRQAPRAVFLNTDFSYYRQVSSRIFDALESGFSTHQASIDEAYIDLDSAIDWTAAVEAGKHLQAFVAQASGGLSASVGIGPNRLVAKIASDRHKPGGLTVVAPDQVRDFLGPLWVGVVPGIGPKAQQALDALDVPTLGVLRSWSVEELQGQFGSYGPWLHDACRGVQRTYEGMDRASHRSMSSERTYGRDVASRSKMMSTLRSLMAGLERQLERYGYWYRTVTVKVRYHGFETHTRQASLPRPAHSTWAARVLVPRLLDAVLEPGRPVRLLGLRFGEIAGSVEQRELTSFPAAPNPGCAAGPRWHDFDPVP